MLILVPRLERYAAAFPAAQVIRTPTKAPPSPAVEMHPCQGNPSRAAHLPYFSADVRNLDLQRTGRDRSRLARSSSMITSPSQVNGTFWIDGTPPPPRMFPGVVHERTRRRSLRQGSSSEKDANTTHVDVTTVPRLLTSEQAHKDVQKTVAEESDELDN